jgi:hypothetical protein
LFSQIHLKELDLFFLCHNSLHTIFCARRHILHVLNPDNLPIFLQ